MSILAVILTVLVALLHCYFLVLEMFLWTKPKGLKTFGMSPELAADTRALAQNQGLYNGFLVVALVLSLCLEPSLAMAFRYYGLGCVIVAGVYGAATAKKEILFIQAFPAALALLFSILSQL